MRQRWILHLTVLLAFLILVVPVRAAQEVEEDLQPIIGEALALARVRLTYYLHGGLTYHGERTYPGSAACSWDFPYGTRLRFPHGEVVRCNDRGRLGWNGWVDVFGNRRDLTRLYGDYVTVEVLVG